MDYSIVEVYEILHYKIKSNTLFKDYNKTWLKIKTESSRYPPDLLTDKIKQFIADFMAREDVNLDPTNMEKNSGKRFISKLMLNSLWKGWSKTQSANYKNCKVVQRKELHQNSKIEILGDEQIGSMLLVNYKYIQDEMAKVGNTSVAIASFTTSYSRLELYDQLDFIEKSNPGSVLYLDTDSIVFLHKPGC